MLLATFAVSLIPFSIHMTQGSEAPFLFNMWLRLGVAGGCVAFLIVQRSPLGLRHLRPIAQRIFLWPANAPVLLAILGSIDFALFAWSTAFIQIPAAVVIFEMHPIILMVTTSQLFRTTGRYQKLGASMSLPLLLCVLGLIFANASQFEHLSDLNPGFILDSIFGMAILAAAVGSTSLTVVGIHWGTTLKEKLSKTDDPEVHELHYVVLALLIISVASLPLNLIPAVITHESLSANSALAAVLTGLTANAVASIAWRKFTLVTRNLGTNAIAFTTPVLSIIWLYWIGNVQVTRWDYLAVGALAIILANLLITFKRDTTQSPTP